MGIFEQGLDKLKAMARKEKKPEDSSPLEATIQTPKRDGEAPIDESGTKTISSGVFTEPGLWGEVKESNNTLGVFPNVGFLAEAQSKQNPDGDIATDFISKQIQIEMGGWKFDTDPTLAKEQLELLYTKLMNGFRDLEKKGYSNLSLARIVNHDGKLHLVALGVGASRVDIVKSDGSVEGVIFAKGEAREAVNAIGRMPIEMQQKPLSAVRPLDSTAIGVSLVSSNLTMDSDHLETEIKNSLKATSGSGEKLTQELVKDGISRLRQSNAKDAEEISAVLLQVPEREISEQEVSELLNPVKVTTLQELLDALEKIQKYDFGDKVGGVISSTDSRPGQKIYETVKTASDELADKNSVVYQNALRMPLTAMESVTEMKMLRDKLAEQFKLGTISRKFGLRPLAMDLVLAKYKKIRTDNKPL